MTTSLAENDEYLEGLQSVASALLSCKVENMAVIGGGRNSRVYRVMVSGGARYALKAYFRHASDNRTRMRTEFESLQFLWRHGLRNIPEPLVSDERHSCALYSWVNGRRFEPHDVTGAAIKAASSFLKRLVSLRTAPGSDCLGPASEACFSGTAIIENLRRRLTPLQERTNHLELAAFLSDRFIPGFTRIFDWSQQRLGSPFDAELPQDARTLSPSDFGFHNALQSGNGEIFFLDMEYFGWDDPTKMICDFLLHPAMRLGTEFKRQYATSVLSAFPHVAGLSRRVEAFYPLFGLKWCMILLNEFLPEHLLRRRFAGMSEPDRHEKETEQLNKAEDMLRQIIEEYEHFPYFA